MMKTMYGSVEMEELMASSDEDFEVQLAQIRQMNIPSHTSKYRNIVKISVIILSIFSLAVIIFMSIQGPPKSYNIFLLYSKKTPLDTYDLSFTLQRQNYPVLSMFTSSASNFLKYKMLDGYNAVIEPYAPMQLVMLGSDADTTSYAYKLKLCSTTDESCTEISYHADEESNTVAIPCTPHSTYTLTVSEFEADSDIKTGRTASGKAKCMYVRREISSLTDEDLAETMDALHALWEYPEEEGQKKFGSDYHSSTYFSEAHHFHSAWVESDHIHEGLGFTPQHIKLTNRVEKAMQAVNPKVFMPYWEFTKEVAEGKSIFDSYMFTEKTFGTLFKPKDTRYGFSPSTESVDDGAIQDGRWAKLLVEPLRYSGLTNAYGMLKAPWSLNPSKYVTRFAADTPSLPACSQYSKAASFLDGTFIEFLDIIQKDPHASLHQVIGNTYGCDYLSSLADAGVLYNSDTAKIGLCKAWSYYMKDLYRNKFITAQLSTTVKSHKGKESSELTCDGTSENSCGYVCDSSRLPEMATFLSQLVNSRFVPPTVTSDDWLKYVDFICTGDAKKMYIGTHMESSSSADPSFWPAHPTQERIMHAKMMANLITTWEWPTSSTEAYVCDTSNCYSVDTGTKDHHSICCKGHYEYDTLMDFVNGDRTGSFGETNHDVLVATNPVTETYSMPYIYDEFDWSHCGEEDILPIFAQQYETVSEAAKEGIALEVPVFYGNTPGQAGGSKVLRKGALSR